MREIIKSVGLDIGTTTTQLVFSRLTLENTGSDFSVPRVSIAQKEIVYQSPVHFTPLASQSEIDAEKLRALIESEYAKAGLSRADVQTGAVIITGETARRNNAKQVLEMLGELAGDFVAVTAGPALEGVLAGKGTGADVFSREQGARVVNIDIGGGTSNLAVFDRGQPVETACLDIGGRLIKVDPGTGQITYISEKVRQLIDREGLGLRVGDVCTPETLRPVTDKMAQVLMQSISALPEEETLRFFSTETYVPPIRDAGYVSFSGGVADLIDPDGAQPDAFAYGDIGVLLGQSLARLVRSCDIRIFHPRETIRATVVGAGSYSTSLSGSTIFYAGVALPLKNLPVARLDMEAEQDEKSLAQAAADSIARLRGPDGPIPAAISVTGIKNPTFSQVQAYARGLYEGTRELWQSGPYLVVIVENDMAKALGQALYVLLAGERKLVCIDSVGGFTGGGGMTDYIDIGRPLAGGAVLPVVVKTIAFPTGRISQEEL